MIQVTKMLQDGLAFLRSHCAPAHLKKDCLDRIIRGQMLWLYARFMALPPQLLKELSGRA
jgi:hypothetical protein